MYPQYGNTDHTNKDRFDFNRPCDFASASLSTIGIGTVILSPDYAFWIFCSQSKNTWCKLKRGWRQERSRFRRRRWWWRGGSLWGSLALWGRSEESPSPSRAKNQNWGVRRKVTKAGDRWRLHIGRRLRLCKARALTSSSWKQLNISRVGWNLGAMFKEIQGVIERASLTASLARDRRPPANRCVSTWLNRSFQWTNSAIPTFVSYNILLNVPKLIQFERLTIASVRQQHLQTKNPPRPLKKYTPLLHSMTQIRTKSN